MQLIALLALPLLLMPLLWVFPARLGRYLSLATASGQLIYTVWLLFGRSGGAEPCYAIDLPWFALNLDGSPLLQVRFSLAAGGLQWLMLVLSGLVLTLSAMSAIHAIKTKERAYHALFLLLCTAIPGCFVAQDAFLFYVFFEVMLIPMYFMVGLWGGPRREFAAIQFFLYTLVGSLLILAGFAVSYLLDNPARMLGLGHLPQAAAAAWQAPLAAEGWLHGISIASAVFWALLIGFLIKLPAVPLHTWLPVAHTEAPTPVSILLAGILLKTGGYGILYWAIRLFPAAAAEAITPMGYLGGISIAYAALLALAAQDLKRLVACSSISHMGFVLLGFATGSPLGNQGAVFQLVSHGIISAGLFAAAGAMQHLTGTRDITAVEGLAGAMPRFSVLLAALCFAGMGLPGFSGFVGEFLVLVAGFDASANGQLPWPVLGLALGGLLATSGFFLWALRRMLMGQFYLPSGSNATHTDVGYAEALLLWAAVLLTLLLGLYPQPWLELWPGKL